MSWFSFKHDKQETGWSVMLLVVLALLMTIVAVALSIDCLETLIVAAPK